MQRKKYIVGNWKMFKTADTAYNDFLTLKNQLTPQTAQFFNVGICAPFVFLKQLADYKEPTDIYAQNVYWETSGAYTGEISVPMLSSIHVDGSLVGHSERRQYFNETNDDCGKKLQALFKNEMRAIYCVGESLLERESGNVQTVIETQLREALKYCEDEVSSFVSKNDSHPYSLLSIAYEPVWAIGTGKAATPKDANDVHVFIRATLTKILGKEIAEKIRILYGGSVKLSNVKEFCSYTDIDGALVGGASLDPNEFFKLCLSCV